MSGIDRAGDVALTVDLAIFTIREGDFSVLLVQRGTIRVGDIFVAGSEWGRVRALLNDRGEPIVSAGPSTPA